MGAFSKAGQVPPLRLPGLPLRLRLFGDGQTVQVPRLGQQASRTFFLEGLNLSFPESRLEAKEPKSLILFRT